LSPNIWQQSVGTCGTLITNLQDCKKRTLNWEIVFHKSKILNISGKNFLNETLGN
jgi:hypothetical protein